MGRSFCPKHLRVLAIICQNHALHSLLLNPIWSDWWFTQNSKKFCCSLCFCWRKCLLCFLQCDGWNYEICCKKLIFDCDLLWIGSFRSRCELLCNIFVSTLWCYAWNRGWDVSSAWCRGWRCSTICAARCWAALCWHCDYCWYFMCGSWNWDCCVCYVCCGWGFCVVCFLSFHPFLCVFFQS